MSDPNFPYGHHYASTEPSLGGPTGFLGALFDFSFTHFVTPKIVKFVYALAVVAVGLVWVIVVLVSFSQSGASGFAALIFGPIGILIFLAFIRMTLEFYLAVTRMSEDIHKRLPGA